MIRVLLIPSSDYLGHPFPQRHNHIFERLHDGKDVEVHIIRFKLFGDAKLESKCIIHEIPGEYRSSNAGFYYLINAVNHLKAILRIIRNESIDIVIAGNLLPPFIYKLTSSLVAEKIPFIFDLQDYYPVSAAGYIANVDTVTGNLIRGFFESMTRAIIKRADFVTVPGIALYYYVRSIGKKEVAIIPNGISEFFFTKYDGKDIRYKLGFDQNDLVMGYIGSIEFWLDMKPLIEGVAYAKNMGIPIRLLIVGKHLQTGYSNKVEKWLSQYDIDRITVWLDFIRHDEVPKYIAAIDIGTIPFNINNLTAYYAAPNKLWEYLSQDVVVAATPIPEVVLYSKFIKRIQLVNNYIDYLNVIKAIYMKSKINDDKNLEKIIRKRTWSNSAQLFKNVIYKTLQCRR